MSLTDLLPLLTGGGGAIFALLLGYALILTGKLVTGREHNRLLADYEKVAQANDTISASLQGCRDTNQQLLSSGQLTTRLLDALTALASQRVAESSARPDKGGG